MNKIILIALILILVIGIYYYYQGGLVFNPVKNLTTTSSLSKTTSIATTTTQSSTEGVEGSGASTTGTGEKETSTETQSSISEGTEEASETTTNIVTTSNENKEESSQQMDLERAIIDGARNIIVNFSAYKTDSEIVLSGKWSYKGDVFFLYSESPWSVGSTTQESEFSIVRAPATVIGFYNKSLNALYVMEDPSDFVVTYHVRYYEEPNINTSLTVYLFPKDIIIKDVKLFNVEYNEVLMVLDNKGRLLLYPPDTGEEVLLLDHDKVHRVINLSSQPYILATNVEGFSRFQRVAFSHTYFTAYWNSTTLTIASYSYDELYNLVVSGTSIKLSPTGLCTIRISNDTKILGMQVLAYKSTNYFTLLLETNHGQYIGIDPKYTDDNAEPIATNLVFFGPFSENYKTVSSKFYEEDIGVVILQENNTVLLITSPEYDETEDTLYYYSATMNFAPEIPEDADLLLLNIGPTHQAVLTTRNGEIIIYNIDKDALNAYRIVSLQTGTKIQRISVATGSPTPLAPIDPRLMNQGTLMTIEYFTSNQNINEVTIIIYVEF